MPEINPIGVVLREARKAKGWKQYDLSEISRVSLSTIRRIEQCDMNVTLGTLRMLANALGKKLTINLE